MDKTTREIAVWEGLGQCGFEDWGKKHELRKADGSRTGKGKKMYSPLEFTGGMHSADTLFLAQWDSRQISGPQNYKIIILSDFKSNKACSNLSQLQKKTHTDAEQNNHFNSSLITTLISVRSRMLWNYLIGIQNTDWK